MTRAALRLYTLSVVGLAACSEPAPTAPAHQAAPTVVAPTGEPAAPLPARALIFGRPPHLSHTRDEYEPLAHAIGAAIGHRVEVRVPGSYDEVVDLLVAGEIDIAMLTPFTYVKAHDRVPGLRLLASILGEGSPKYRGYIVAKLGSPIHDLADLRGKRFAFVDRGSASGYLFPFELLREAGIDPERDFAAVQFAGNHPEAVHRVLDGRADAAAISSTTFVHLRDENIQAKVNIVAKTEWIPLDAVVAHPSLPEAVASQIRDLLIGLNMRTNAGRDVLRGVTTTNAFVPSDDSAYDPVRRVAAQVKGSQGSADPQAPPAPQAP